MGRRRSQSLGASGAVRRERRPDEGDAHRWGAGAHAAGLIRERFAHQIDAALRVARSRGECLAAVSWELVERIDPSALVLAARAEQEPWFCFEQPERERSVVAALGAAATLEDRGERRFATIARRWRELAAHACVAAADGPPGSGLIASGGFAFAPDGGAARHWSEFSAASLVVPAISFARRGERVSCTLVVLARPDDLAEELLAGAEDHRLARLPAASIGVLDPLLAGERTIGGTMAPEHYESAVERAVELIAAATREDRARARSRRARSDAPTTSPPCSACCATCSRAASARRWTWELDIFGRDSRAAGASRRHTRKYRRVSRFDCTQRRPGGRRPPRRAPAALSKRARGTRDRGTPHRVDAAHPRGLGNDAPEP